MHDSNLSLRPIEPEDHEFLCQVYASTREQDLAPVPWTAAQKDAFLRSQFNAQHQYYQEHYAGAALQVILRDGRPAGRLYVARWDEEIRIVDIALLPEHRRAGIGSSLLKDILAEGARAQKPVTIHVEQFNPALRWYERLGFRPKGEFGVYLLLEFSPFSPSAQRTIAFHNEPERTQRAASLSPREERVGREPERGAAQQNQSLLSPALSSLLRREEREKSPSSRSRVQSANPVSGNLLPHLTPEIAWAGTGPDFTPPTVSIRDWNR